MLPVQVSDEFLDELFTTFDEQQDFKVSVDLEKQLIRNEVSGTEESFEINTYKKYCLTNGYDDIDYLMSLEEEINAFEEKVSSL